MNEEPDRSGVAGGVVVLCAICVVASIMRPEVAHLVVQLLIVMAVIGLGAFALQRLVDTLPPGPFARGWRPRRRSRSALPRDLAALTGQFEHGTRGVLPPAVVGRISSLFQDRLALSHRLSPDRDDDLDALQGLLSPLAFRIVTVRRSRPLRGEHPFERVPLADFDRLMTELEHL